MSNINRKLDFNDGKSTAGVQKLATPSEISAFSRSTQSYFEKTNTISKSAKQKLHDAFQKYDKGLCSKENFKSLLYNELKIARNEILDSKLNEPHIKFAQLMKFIEKNEKYPVFTHYKPTQVDPNKNNSNISACTPSLMSFQQRNLSIDNWETRERFPEKHEILHNVKGLLDGQVDTNLLRAKLFDMGINNEEIDKEIRNFNSDHYGSFSKFAAKLLRGIKEKHENGIGDSPQRTNCFINDDYIKKLHLSKEKQLHSNFESPSKKYHDKQRKQDLERFLNNTYMDVKKKPPDSTRAINNNGNIITWERSKKPIDDDFIEKNKKKTFNKNFGLQSTVNLASDHEQIFVAPKQKNRKEHM